MMILPPFDVGSSYHCIVIIILLLHTTLPYPNFLPFFFMSNIRYILPSGNITPSDYTNLPVMIADRHSTLFNLKIHSSATVEHMNLLHCQVNLLVIFSFNTSWNHPRSSDDSLCPLLCLADSQLHTHAVYQ